MCGFVAIFRPHGAPIDRALLDHMTDALAHRGPDGRGTFTTEGCGLGHRRLAIIDLDGGAQPLFGADERLAIVFNGEAFDYREARARLPGPWRTNSDTEVFLRSYEVHGLAGLEHLTGMWGTAIWDGRTRELVVVRDRLGKKPVYYARLADGGYAFASELRALLLHPDVARDLDPTALDQLLTYRYVPAPRTMFRGIKKLLPGHAAIASDRGLRIERYWAPRPEPRAWRDDDAEASFLAAFDRSVQLRMVSDVPVGIFLSGGIDSAAVLDAMRQRDVHAFTVAFAGGEADDETAYARETAALYGARHHTITIGPSDYAGYLDRYAAQLEEPVLNDSAIAVHFLSKLAREHVKVVLSGQGADEPLAGYDRYKGELLSAAYRHVPGRAIVEPWALRLVKQEKVQRAVRSLGEADDVARALRIYAVFDRDEKRALLGGDHAIDEDTAAPVARLHAEVPHLSPLGRMLYTDTRLWLVDDLLLVADKLSMAHGLELRVPFLDHHLVELLESMPDDQKLRLGRRGFETKRVHRAAMARRLPPAILGRKKRGFTNPLDAWLRTALRPMVEERLLAPGARIHRLVDREALRALAAEHQSGRRDRRRQLFLLLTLDAWLGAFAAPT
ncbi:asparagine synthase (glutamine-hydrolyzing) [Myxococcota bacterium]|nr:asparagine synthase (glutamine-hydrolyzing) [Myxococcota bacterium]